VLILTYGIRITIGVGEEKASRVVEVLLTTLRPVQLLAGTVYERAILRTGSRLKVRQVFRSAA
jgi:ABC-2 type transport system permease protein